MRIQGFTHYISSRERIHIQTGCLSNDDNVNFSSINTSERQLSNFEYIFLDKMFYVYVIMDRMIYNHLSWQCHRWYPHLSPKR